MQALGCWLPSCDALLADLDSLTLTPPDGDWHQILAQLTSHLSLVYGALSAGWKLPGCNTLAQSDFVAGSLERQAC
jgi:hypothetical protein